MTTYVINLNNEIRFVSQKLSYRVLSDFQRSLLYALQARGSKRIVLNFSAVTIAYANLMVPLISMIDRARRDGATFHIVAPSSKKAKHIFKRLGWLQALDPVAFRTYMTEADKFTSIRMFTNEQELGLILNELLEETLKHVEFSKGVPQAFEWALNEIGGNIFIHSEARCGWLQIIAYPGSAKLALVICDSGLGIPHTIKKAFTVQDDLDALCLSIEKEVTSKPDVGYGNGLAGSLAIAVHNEGFFGIVSGNASLKVLNREPSGNDHFPCFNGSSIEMQLSTNRPIDLPAVLWGHEPCDFLERRFMREDGRLQVTLADHFKSTDRADHGSQAKVMLKNLIAQSDVYPVHVTLTGAESQPFLEAAIGQIADELGEARFNDIVKLEVADEAASLVLADLIPRR